MTGLHLHRTDENGAEIAALTRRLGGPVPLPRFLADLDRRGRRSPMRARAVHRAWTFDAADRRDPRWWPQGITTSADAEDDGLVAGRRLVVVSWYAKSLPGDAEDAGGAGNHGSRVSVLDLATRRYAHVLLVTATADGGLAPLRVHAGGIVWHGPYLHVAATARGFHTFRWEDLLAVPDPAESFGHRYVLPVRFSYRAGAAEGVERLRYSFLSLDRSAHPPGLLAGEYALGSGPTRRLARFPLEPTSLLLDADDDGHARPTTLRDGVGQMQGAVAAAGRLHVTVSQGPWRPGTVVVGGQDAPAGSWRRHRYATPMGPEDIAYWPGEETLWSVSEHPRRRWVYSMRRAWFDRRG